MNTNMILYIFVKTIVQKIPGMEYITKKKLKLYKPYTKGISSSQLRIVSQKLN